MEKLRRLCTFQWDEEPKMHTIYKSLGKFGTGPTTILYFDRIPKVGEECYGVCEDVCHCNPYESRYAFRYVEFNKLEVYNIHKGEGEDYIFCNYA